MKFRHFFLQSIYSVCVHFLHSKKFLVFCWYFYYKSLANFFLYAFNILYRCCFIIITLLSHICNLFIKVFNFLVFGPLNISTFLSEHLLIWSQNLNFIFIGTQFFLELVIYFIHPFKLRLLPSIKIFYVLFDLDKSVLILWKNWFLILIFSFQ